MTQAEKFPDPFCSRAMLICSIIWLGNLPHIASMAFNEPLMLEPAYARVFFCALAGQLGISRLTDAVSGDSLTAGEAPATLALSVNDAFCP